MRRGPVWVAVALTVAACGVGTVASGVLPGSGGDQEPAAPCRAVHYQVKLPSARQGQLTGDLCAPAQADDNGTVLVLVAGGGEDADYWNMPGLAANSMVTPAVRAGFTTLALDRLGTGRSTRPPSSAVTYDAQVSTVDQVVTALHHAGWARVVGVGHSLGSGVLVGLAARHPADLAALVLTGYGSAVSPATPQRNALYQKPANKVDPTKWGSLDSGYVTVVPSGVPDDGLFYLPTASKAAVAASQSHQDTLTKTELATRPQGAAAAAQGAALHLPTLLLDGQEDEHYCTSNTIHAPVAVGPRCSTQAAFRSYGRTVFPNAQLTTHLMPRTGHVIEMQTTAASANKVILKWTTDAVPPPT